MRDKTPRSTSVAALLDRKIMKQRITNGDSLSHQANRSATTPSSSQDHIPTELCSPRPSSSPTSLTQDSTERKCSYINLEDIDRNQQSTNDKIPTAIHASAYDPRVLLNPRSVHGTKGRKKDAIDTASSSEVETPPQRPLSAAPQFIFDSSNEDSLVDEQTESEGAGFGKLIEQVHNVSKREERPVKRQKIEHPLEEDVNGSQTAFVGGGRGGEIGEYMRQKRKEGLEESGPAPSFVDLTAGKYSATAHRRTRLISSCRR